MYIRLTLAALLATTFSLPAHAGLYVFGDSLSDAGNVWDASKNTPNLLPDPMVGPGLYWEGRMSNGKNWADYVAEDLGMGQTSASRLGGNNYAWAGATLGAGVTPRQSLVVAGQIQGVDNVGKQLQTFVSNVGGFANNDLVLHWGGANDILYGAIGAGTATQNGGIIAGQAQVAATVTEMLVNTQGNLLTLEGLGATRIVLPNQIDASYAPIWNGSYGLPSSLKPFVSAITTNFNAQLPSLVAALEASPGFDADIVLVDMYTPTLDFFAKWGSYGFDNGTAPQFPSNVLSPDEYLFWDPIHPTTGAHRIIADVAMAALVPEPGVWLQLVCGLGLLVALGAARRNR